METGSFETLKTSSAAQAEIVELRAKAAALEAKLRQEGVPAENSPSAAAQQTVAEHWKNTAPQQIGGDASDFQGATEKTEQIGAITLELTPEEHDSRMGELIGVLQEKGVAAAIAAAEAAGNAHLIDDFHRVLVEYVREGLPSKGSAKKAYARALSMVLYEVTLPLAQSQEKPADPAKAIHDFVALMEQFYRGMLQIDAKKGEYFSFEIANPVGAMHTTVYVAVPRSRRELFQKQLLGLYPEVRLLERHDDYNAFVNEGVVAATRATFAERPIYSLRTHDAFSNDPLDVLLNGFSKLDQTGEGAALQVIVSPQDKGLDARYKAALVAIRSGVSIKDATNIKTGIERFTQEVASFFAPTKKLDVDKRPGADDPRIKNIEHKIASPILHADIRLVSSAQTSERASAILDDLKASFQQFTDTSGNALQFTAVSPRKIKNFAHTFSYRLFDQNEALPLSVAELATIAHVPRPQAREAAPELRQEKSHVAPAPQGLAQSGTLLGVNRFRGSTIDIYIQPEDRLRHFYVIGQTGTGKSWFLKNIVAQDIRSGAGVCYIDPHGTDIMDILSIIPPEREKDVIYFDPAHIERPMGLNMLEYDVSRPEQKTLVVDELFGIFRKLFGAIPESMGPAFEQYFRNSALLVMEDPASGNTLLDIGRIFSDPAFRARKLAACKNPIVKAFWEGIAEQATGEQGLQNYGPYVTSKFDQFTTNEFVRPIIAQQKSAFNFRDIMDDKKILLVNLAKGRLGDLNANLLGLVIVGKFLIAALSRADSFGKDFPPFYLHIDEFQNFATPSIATILSEARKYKLSLTIAHQFIAQLSEEIRDAVFGNVGSICSFRIGAGDAEFLEKQFAPTFSAADLMQVDNFNAFLKLLIGGKPATPFNIETLPFVSGPMERVEAMRQLSYQTYGHPREEIEQKIASDSNLAVPPAALQTEGV
ncbi:MAG: DUF87 domain-containing protein [bacterium]|nr:DUF87 domain-containing protein [bacterium]